MPVPKILVVPGSLRPNSHNSRLAALTAKELALAGAEVTRISLVDYPLPLFDAEMTAEVGPPQNAVQLQRMLSAHHGVFITSPEYNASVTPVLINTIVWLSRARARGEPTYAAFQNRVFAIGAASSGSTGGLRALAVLRQILEQGCGALVLPGEIAVANAGAAFDDMDNLKDEDLSAALKALVRRLIELARNLGGI